MNVYGNQTHVNTVILETFLFQIICFAAAYKTLF